LNERNLRPSILNTTDFLYLRLLGDYGTKCDRDGQRSPLRRLLKREAAMESWSLKIERHLADSRSV
jgi:hypothetical protein